MAEITKSVNATGVVSAQPGYYTGYVITTAVATADVVVYDNASAASGTIIDVIPVGAAGGFKNLAAPIKVRNGIYASFGGTGTVTFVYD